MESRSSVFNSPAELIAGSGAAAMASDDPHAVRAACVAAQESDLYAVAELGYD